MAGDRGRDFKVSFLSDTDRFELKGPINQLENLGDAAKGSQRTIDTSMDRIEKSVDGVGDKAHATATKVDNAFEKIAASSRSNLRKVDNDADHAKKSLDDFKDEAHDTGREAAASFSGGFEDITDAVQEIGANAFSKLGKTGMLAGGALAIALGFVVSKAQEANEKIKELRDNYFAFMKGTDANNPAKGLQEFMDSLDADQLNDFDDALKATGISQREFYAAMAEGGDRAKALRERLNDMVGINMPWDTQAMEAQHLSNALGDTIKAHEGAAGAAETYNDVVGDTGNAVAASTKAIEEQAAAAERVTGSIKSSVANVADAKDEIGDLVTEAEKKGKLTLKAMTKTLQEQTKAAQQQQKNLQVAMQEGGAEFAEYMAGLPAEAAAAYAKGSAKEKAAFRQAAFANMGVPMGAGVAAGMDSKVPAVEQAALRARAAAKRGALGDGPIVIPTTVKAPSAADIARVRGTMQNLLGTIAVKAVAEATVRKVP